MQQVIVELYRQFLLDSAESDELQYATLADELTANFIHKAYISTADIRHCVSFDVATLAHHPVQEVIGGLHAETLALIESEEALAA
jgi:hypothetical protein